MARYSSQVTACISLRTHDLPVDYRVVALKIFRTNDNKQEGGDNNEGLSGGDDDEKPPKKTVVIMDNDGK